MKVIIILLLLGFCIKFYLDRKKYSLHNEELKTENIKLEEENKKLYDKYKDVIDIDKEINIRQIQSNDIEKKIKQIQEDYNKKASYYNQLLEAIDILQIKYDILDVCLYEPHFDFADSQTYKENITKNYENQKKCIQSGYAVSVSESSNSEYYSERENRVINAFLSYRQKENVKLILKAFNAECDSLIAKVDWKNVKKIETKIRKIFNDVNKYAQASFSHITPDFLNLKLEQLYLTHEYHLKKQEEKEEQKRIQEQIREEQKAIKEFEAAKLQAEKEEQTYQKALLQAQKELEKASEAERSAFEEKIALLQAQLKEAEEKRERAISQAQLTKSGHIYVISNIGSFGENIYKIGMTRRLEPMDRINELGDASVPFKFDVHALIYSDNAPELEAKLHSHFRDRAVNLVNLKKEFFNVSLEEIEKVVHENYAEIEFTKIAEAKDYRETLAIRKSKNIDNVNDKNSKLEAESKPFPASL